ncbi:FtsX-like permease family protein [Halobium palmae]|uniref:FtsX-like permease family protein n=1 Tax=Halobium palmae TaxID=1776492 RepID=A0ABD5RV41_9EURY
MLELGSRRTANRLTGADARRALLSITGVAIAIMLMTTVSGIALGLASGSTVAADGVDYWIVPESGGTSSVAVSVSGPQLGQVHSTAASLQRDEHVDYATPVSMRVIRVGNPTTGDEEYLLAVGIVPPESGADRTVAGLPTGPLQPGDPHYANGEYNGPWTGEAVLSNGAAELLNASTGSELAVRTGGQNRQLRVENTSAGGMMSGAGSIPVALVHLSELQSITGSTANDQADQLLVSTNDQSIRADLQGIYPRSQVITRDGVSGDAVSTSSLPVAMALAALTTAVIIGVLFVATMMGLQVTADRRNLATLTVVGFSQRTRGLLVATETVATALIGGLVGVGLGYLGIVFTNLGAAELVGVSEIAMFRPELALYGIIVAGLIGLLAAPYPVWLSSRASLIEVLSR